MNSNGDFPSGDRNIFATILRRLISAWDEHIRAEVFDDFWLGFVDEEVRNAKRELKRVYGRED
jgi:hypothetical protein